jgi:hypothetical protein
LYNGNCYVLNQTPMTNAEGQAYCASLNQISSLIYLDSASEISWLKSSFIPSSLSNYAIWVYNSHFSLVF